MNPIFSFANSLSQGYSLCFREQVLVGLTQRQRLISTIVSTAAAIFAVAAALFAVCFVVLNLNAFYRAALPLSPSVSPSSLKRVSPPIAMSISPPVIVPGKFQNAPIRVSPTPIFGYQGANGVESDATSQHSDLLSIEEKMRLIFESLEEQEIRLKTLQSATIQASDIHAGIFEEITEEVEKTRDQLHEVLKEYLGIFSSYLKGEFANSNQGLRNRSNSEIFEHIIAFSAFLEKNSDHEDFIYQSLTMIDLFLTEAFFNSGSGRGLCLRENIKLDLIVLHEFFPIVEKYFNVIQQKDPQLALNLKVKLANLPLAHITERHQKFPNVYLTEKDQLTLLVDHFQQQEDHHLKALIDQLSFKQNFTELDLHRLSKMVVTEDSHLREENQSKLRLALRNQMGASVPANWDSSKTVEGSLRAFYLRGLFSHFYSPISMYGFTHEINNHSGILSLHRASKARVFFDRQTTLPEDQIQIPRWYHATDYSNLDPIITSGKIEVRHKQAFNGAWVSDQIEQSMGGMNPSALVFNSRITKIDPDVFIGFEQNRERWRGSQHPIPLAGSNTVSNLLIVGVYKDFQKISNQNHKKDVRKKLQKENLGHVTVVSVDQIDYVQKEFMKILGNPNLNEKWWGKADTRLLERPFAPGINVG